MKKKPPVPFSQRLPNADPLALRLLERLLAFDPRDRPSAEEIRISKTNYTIRSLFLRFVLFIFTGLDRSILQ